MTRSTAPIGPQTRIRPQIQDLVNDNIAILAEAEKRIDGVIPLWFGEGDLVTPGFIRDAAKRALDEGRTFYVPDMRGAPRLTQALAEYQTRLYDRDIELNRTTVTPGGMQAVSMAMALLIEPGSNVVYVAPQWPNIANAIFVAGGEPRPCPLTLRNGTWHLDLERLESFCDARTRAIIFSSPSNPTGWTATRDELLGLLNLARRLGVWIISDEVYARLYFDGRVAPSMLQVADPDDLVLCVNSFSKAWAMTGFRLGWLNHPACVADKLGAMTQYLNSGTPDFIQQAGVAALTEGESFAREMRERCRDGVALTYERFRQVGKVRLTRPPRGGMYVFFWIDGWPDGRAASRNILERARVGLAPGELFGPSTNGWLRMCVCRDPAQLGEALDRIAEALRE